MSFFSLTKKFAKLRNSGYLPWLKEYSFVVAREPLRTMAQAFRAFFQGRGHPRFKVRGRDHPRFTVPDGVRIKGNHLSVPNVGWVKLRCHGGNPHPQGTPVKVSAVCEAGKGYATVCYKVEISPCPEPELVAAMDRNCGQVVVAYSDGTRENHPQPKVGIVHVRLKRAQRKLSRQKKGSRRRGRTKLRIRKLHGRVRNMANNWRHRLTRHLAHKARLVVLEKLSTQEMTASAKGTQEAPGTNVKAKSGLNRSIRQQGGLRLSRYSPTKYGLSMSTPHSPPRGAQDVVTWTPSPIIPKPFFVAQAVGIRTMQT